MKSTTRFTNLDAVRGETISGDRAVLSYGEGYRKGFNKEMR